MTSPRRTWLNIDDAERLATMSDQAWRGMIYNGQRNIEHQLAEILDDLQEIKRETRATNGRVTRLENWRWGLAGAIAIVAGGMPILVWILDYVTSRE